MSQATGGSALKRVLNRSLGITEKMSWRSKETIALDKAYQDLLAIYDTIPPIDPSWKDLALRYKTLTERMQGLEATAVTNTPAARIEHQGVVDKTAPVAQRLKDAVIEKVLDYSETTYKARIGPAKKLHTTVLGKAEAPVQASLVAWLKEVEDPAALPDYVAALPKLLLLEKALAAATSLEQATAKGRKKHASAVAIVVDPDRATVNGALAAADNLLAHLGALSDAAKDLAAAEAGFTALSEESFKAMKNKAKALETADGGHSLDRHGPEVSDQRLLRRVQTGIAADDQLSPTNSSTKFDEIEAWLETRDAGVQNILGKVQALLTPLGVTIDAAPQALKKMSVIFEHGKPIDTGHVADLASGREKPKMEGGNPVYEKDKTGNPKWMRNAKGFPVDKNGDQVACTQQREPIDEDGNIVSSVGDLSGVQWTDGKAAARKLDTYTVYSRSTKVSGLTRTLTTLSYEGGGWKVVQHFPTALNWDQATQAYTDAATFPATGKVL